MAKKGAGKPSPAPAPLVSSRCVAGAMTAPFGECPKTGDGNRPYTSSGSNPLRRVFGRD